MNEILIGGKERPVCIGWGTFKEFGKLTSRTFPQVMNLIGVEADQLGFDDIEKLVFASLKIGAEKENQKLDIKLKDISQIFEDDLQALTRFMEIYSEELAIILDEKNLPAPETGH